MSRLRVIDGGKKRPTQQLVDIDAEREVLGCVLVGTAEQGLEILSAIEPEAWGLVRHKDIAEAMHRVCSRGSEPEVVAVAQELQDMGVWETHGAARCMGEILDRVGTVRNWRSYVERVRRIAATRRLSELAHRLQVDALTRGDELDDVLGEARRDLEAVAAPTQTGLRLGDWTMRRYVEPAPPVHWLVPDILARGDLHLLAATGDTGKGMLSLSLCLQLASGIYETGRRAPFGRAILPLAEPVDVVCLYAEDSADALARRLEAIDHDGVMRRAAGDRFAAVPMPSVGGAWSVMGRSERDTYDASPQWTALVSQLKRERPNLGLLVLDPLASFCSFELDSESAVASYLTGLLAAACSELGVAGLVSHHMRKTTPEPSARGALTELPTHETVRAAIRGTSALLNGVRMAYGIVPMPGRYAKAVLQRLGERGEYDVGRVYWGAVVKANGRLDRKPRLYVRHECGLLEDRTGDLVPMGGRLDEALRSLVAGKGGEA